MFKVGFAYDSHRFTKSRPLFLGGVEIESDLGLKGHSDADVLLHALIDALLGAIGSGDIGTHFPDDEPQYKDISSLKLLDEVRKEVKEKKYIINNCDLVIVAEKPKLKPYRNQIVNSIADNLKIEKNSINFKATTNEKMGFTGRGEGMAAYAVVSVLESRLWQFFETLKMEGSIR
ncbi:MAG: 2-C-methyl-D-erythritol 2,4-cyclodiphosphate synthase [Halanaerobium sp. 4-GBenrich]|jgi:2-C-methyl-D-erythritol 2,4-cyclodiphosphate synthase|uniref:2-C-methyl-D-erythritol 2,4-cyclodiphosphate synthase n=1 Tax=Halanaerobium congolense TaxID=54121 RepID=A0A1G6SU71_9FIRM|nr:2-C-methyl-D-erythritol 2,4-cyclodiphosphate synthase [Halanaerobium congolense]KXS49898.1 MAG: 2-C-methyl-D-erythritol 2,4-cyclodiphosphate synthase [Halanaerobium sp. T82-1]ODS50736.1 MAG: 2-C-methyl-D-erythritol 2,4-cyclodiphosphate synthase [Halanaerobium sp. 4-GBenrich]PUU92206.1 MAG: 2-C-methyl-D-erythritol 2,4-cyclodiphosphate synthase [Halanaerobium sp.]PTX15582.1 2-C-methyl-D-erythritol 2,4-cyclodiphosphate synthase [Halanaerobium congolense]PXV62423.1 2-C-methyl-D-erythritol 2,4-c